MKRLVYFNHGLIRPGGMTDPFLLVEQPWLNSHFDRVDAIGEGGAVQLDDSAADGLSLAGARFSRVRAAFLTFFRPEVWQEIFHLLRDGKCTPGNVKRLVFFAFRGVRMALHARHLLADGDDVTLYSFWMSFDGYAAALCRKLCPGARLVLRGHAFDVDVERTPLNPYLMKRMMTRQADGVYLISQTARTQLMAYMQGAIDESRVHVLAMGSGGQPVDDIAAAPRNETGVLQLVSCAALLPIKQVEVLAEALSRWNGMPIKWTHIGDGPGMETLAQLVDEKLSRKENVACHLAGAMKARDVNALYERETFDVFVNTSRREGVPVSIMEAMRCGVPAIAPAVGGIPELITQETGFLYQPEEGADGVLAALERLCSQTPDEAQHMRENAAAHWRKNYWPDQLLPTLFGGDGKE